MHINITAGECLNQIIKEKYPNEIFIPFNEAMINGEYDGKLFSNDFMLERASYHQVTIQEYKNKLKEFITVINNVNAYDEINLYFGDEPFCKANYQTVIKTLKQRNFIGKIKLNIVNEYTGEILKSEEIK